MIYGGQNRPAFRSGQYFSGVCANRLPGGRWNGPSDFVSMENGLWQRERGGSVLAAMHGLRLFNPLKALAGGWLILLLLSTTSQAHVVFNALNRAKGLADRVGPPAFTHTLAGPLASGGSLTVGGGFQSAGGIGGLLARTDANGSAFYDADGVENITAPSDGMESIAARYPYSPFGRITAKSGPLADANVMQFSSMPWLARSGLSLYPFRGCDPGLQRWLNRDLIGEIGGMNLYRLVGNNPISNVDPLGLEVGYVYNGDGGMTLPNADAYGRGSVQFWTGLWNGWNWVNDKVDGAIDSLRNSENPWTRGIGGGLWAGSMFLGGPERKASKE